MPSHFSIFSDGEIRNNGVFILKNPNFGLALGKKKKENEIVSHCLENNSFIYFSWRNTVYNYQNHCVLKHPLDSLPCQSEPSPSLVSASRAVLPQGERRVQHGWNPTFCLAIPREGLVQEKLLSKKPGKNKHSQMGSFKRSCNLRKRAGLGLDRSAAGEAAGTRAAPHGFSQGVTEALRNLYLEQ